MWEKHFSNSPIEPSRIMLLYRRIVPASIVFLYTIYSFSYATGNNSLDYKVVLIFSFLASLALFVKRQPLFSKTVVGIYLFFLVLSSISVIIPFSKYADIDWLIQSIALLLLCSPIVVCFLNCDKGDAPILKWGLLVSLLTLSLLAILHQAGIPLKEVFPEFAGFKPVSHDWNQKYYSFWLLFLLWGTVSLYWGKNIPDIISTIGLIALTAVAIFTGYSDSTKVALVVSAIIFLFMQIRTNRWLLLWQSLIWIYILALPLILNLLPSSWLASIEQLEINNIGFRLDVYNFSAGAVLERWLLGYGFGSTLSLPYPRVTGGHPHNIVLLFWLELGLLGAILLASAATKLLAHINSHDQGNVPAAWAMLTSGLIIFSFSFDIWLPGVVLTYCMWLAMIMLSSRALSRKASHI
jgi:O-antigen ligase